MMRVTEKVIFAKLAFLLAQEGVATEYCNVSNDAGVFEEYDPGCQLAHGGQCGADNTTEEGYCIYPCGQDCTGPDKECNADKTGCTCSSNCAQHPFHKECVNATCVYDFTRAADSVVPDAQCEAYCGAGKKCVYDWRAESYAGNLLPTCWCENGLMGPNCDNFGGLTLTLADDEDPSSGAYAGRVSALNTSDERGAAPDDTDTFVAGSPSKAELQAYANDVQATLPIQGYIVEGRTWMASTCDRGFVKVYGVGKWLEEDANYATVTSSYIHNVFWAKDEKACAYESSTNQSLENVGYWWDDTPGTNVTEKCKLFKYDAWKQLNDTDEVDHFAAAHYSYRNQQTTASAFCARARFLNVYVGVDVDQVAHKRSNRVKYTMFKAAPDGSVTNKKMALAYLAAPAAGSTVVTPRVRVVVKEKAFNGDVFVVSEGVSTVSDKEDKIEIAHASCNQFDLGNTVSNSDNGNERIMQCVLPPRWSGVDYKFKVYNQDHTVVLTQAQYDKFVTDETSNLTWGGLDGEPPLDQEHNRTWTFRVPRVGDSLNIGATPEDPFYVPDSDDSNRGPYTYKVWFQSDDEKAPNISCGCVCASDTCRDEGASGFLEMSNSDFRDTEEYWMGGDYFNDGYKGEDFVADDDNEGNDLGKAGVTLRMFIPKDVGGDISSNSELDSGNYSGFTQNVEKRADLSATEDETLKSVRGTLYTDLPAYVAVEAKAGSVDADGNSNFVMPDPNAYLSFKRCLGSYKKSDLEGELFYYYDANNPRIVKVWDKDEQDTCSKMNPDNSTSAIFREPITALDGDTFPKDIDRMIVKVVAFGEKMSFLGRVSNNGWSTGYLRCQVEITYGGRYCENRLRKRSLLSRMFTDRKLNYMVTSGSPIMPLQFWGAGAMDAANGRSLMGAGKVKFGEMSLAQMLAMQKNTVLLANSVKEHLCGTEEMCMQTVQVAVTGTTSSEVKARSLLEKLAGRLLQNEEDKTSFEVLFSIFFDKSKASAEENLSALQKRVQLATLKFLGAEQASGAFVEILAANLREMENPLLTDLANKVEEQGLEVGHIDVQVSEQLDLSSGSLFLAPGSPDGGQASHQNSIWDTYGPSMVFADHKSAGGQSIITIGLLGLFVAGCSLGLIQAAKNMATSSKKERPEDKFVSFQDSERLQGIVWSEDDGDHEGRQESLRRQLKRQQKKMSSASAETGSVTSSTNDGIDEPAAEPVELNRTSAKVLKRDSMNFGGGFGENFAEIK